MLYMYMCVRACTVSAYSVVCYPILQAVLRMTPVPPPWCDTDQDAPRTIARVHKRVDSAARSSRFEMHGGIISRQRKTTYTVGDAVRHIQRLESAGFSHYFSEQVYTGGNGQVELAFVNLTWLEAPWNSK